MDRPTTMPDLVVEPLPLQQALLAYPLLRHALPGLTLGGWLAFARQVARLGRHVPAGILVARRADQPTLCGAVCFRRDPDPRGGAVLTAEHLVALDLLHPQMIVAAMLAALDTAAVTLECRAVRLIASTTRPDLTRSLELGGHRPAGIVLERLRPEWKREASSGRGTACGTTSEIVRGG